MVNELLVSGEQTFSAAQSQPYFVPGLLSQDAQTKLRNDLVLNHFKWDPQVEDSSTLAPFPLVLSETHLQNLWTWARALSEDLFAAEREILQKPSLLKNLGLPREIRALLSRAINLDPSLSVARILRFDFHYTREGWRLSEVNSDVPGGFTEATVYTQRMADHFPGFEPTGLPSEILSQKFAQENPRARIALLSAPGYMEDYQVVAYIADGLRKKGCEPYLANPAQIHWENGHAFLATGKFKISIDGIFKFFQSEWLPLLPRNVKWSEYFVGGRTPLSNPGIAIIGESKRLPLVWDNLDCPMTTWRALLPETRSPSEVPWLSDETWLVKTAYSNTGDTVCIREFLTPAQWNKIKWEVRLQPKTWLAQRRFEPIPFTTPIGNVFPCLGVYTIDGVPAGIYGRLGLRPWIDYSAIDVPILVERRTLWKN